MIDTHKKFEEWFYGRYGENYGSRAEYFYDDVGSKEEDEHLKRMRGWLLAAFEDGVATGLAHAEKMIDEKVANRNNG